MDKREFSIRVFALVIVTLWIFVVVSSLNHICVSLAAIPIWGILAIVLLTDH